MSTDARRAQVFGQVADLYDRARPTYPLTALRWSLGTAPRTVVDLGAGTGHLTRAVRALGHRVVAVEPSAPMLRVLRSALPDVETHHGSAERIPLPTGSADAVVAGQAYHWFDHRRANPEITRILRPAGRVALLWNTRDTEVAWVAEFERMLLEVPDGVHAARPRPQPVAGHPTVRTGACSPARHDRDMGTRPAAATVRHAVPHPRLPRPDTYGPTATPHHRRRASLNLKRRGCARTPGAARSVSDSVRGG